MASFESTKADRFQKVEHHCARKPVSASSYDAPIYGAVNDPLAEITGFPKRRVIIHAPLVVGVEKRHEVVNLLRVD